jgi:hypothetical protein
VAFSSTRNVDADLADYFGSIPHAELLKSVARRIVDRRVLHLIKMWPECPVEETDDRGRKKRTTEARDKRRGIPQGSPHWIAFRAIAGRSLAFADGPAGKPGELLLRGTGGVNPCRRPSVAIAGG